ncbi:conserved Plasmodium protein, unknown function [Plasmodium sp. gorilla clade G2]|uniref:conserved Plasmodium protein, unknown function n=1 Tax=Plasmodium sp. gorilla clade G2 TaxID=880535 RepID=UPI000D221AD0|nr:conserved Plasmodium protein, unknown function [Plasmodium sp. gorilla clade G2]SOV15606.1 conserved Plasmodium protein, unknown function [Plasmodium sp. gorilla clade G2]
MKSNLFTYENIFKNKNINIIDKIKEKRKSTQDFNNVSIKEKENDNCHVNNKDIQIETSNQKENEENIHMNKNNINNEDICKNDKNVDICQSLLGEDNLEYTDNNTNGFNNISEDNFHNFKLKKKKNDISSLFDDNIYDKDIAYNEKNDKNEMVEKDEMVEKEEKDEKDDKRFDKPFDKHSFFLSPSVVIEPQEEFSSYINSINNNKMSNNNSNNNDDDINNTCSNNRNHIFCDEVQNFNVIDQRENKSNENFHINKKENVENHFNNDYKKDFLVDQNYNDEYHNEDINKYMNNNEEEKLIIDKEKQNDGDSYHHGNNIKICEQLNKDPLIIYSHKTYLHDYNLNDTSSEHINIENLLNDKSEEQEQNKSDNNQKDYDKITERISLNNNMDNNFFLCNNKNERKDCEYNEKEKEQMKLNNHNFHNIHNNKCDYDDMNMYHKGDNLHMNVTTIRDNNNNHDINHKNDDINIQDVNKNMHVSFCFGNNGTFFYSKNSKIKYQYLINIIEINMNKKRKKHINNEKKNDENNININGNTNSNNNSNNNIDSNDIYQCHNNNMEKFIYCIKNFPGPFSRKNNKVDHKIEEFLKGYININKSRTTNDNIFEDIQKNCLYNYLLNILKKPYLTNFNLKEISIEKKNDTNKNNNNKGNNIISYFLDNYQDKKDIKDNLYSSDYFNDDDDEDADGDSLSNNEMDEFDINEYVQNDSNKIKKYDETKKNNNHINMFNHTNNNSNNIIMNNNLYNGNMKYMFQMNNNVDKTEKNVLNKEEKKCYTDIYENNKNINDICINNNTYLFFDFINKEFIMELYKRENKNERITHDDIYLLYFHMCIYNSKKATNICIKKELYKYFFLVLRKYNKKKYYKMLDKYISYIKRSINNELEMKNDMKNIYKIYNYNIYDEICTEAFVFFLCILNKKNMVFKKDILVNYWYVFYTLIFHNFIFQYKENEIQFEDYKEDIINFFIYLIHLLYEKKKNAEAQFLLLLISNNPFVFAFSPCKKNDDNNLEDINNIHSAKYCSNKIYSDHIDGNNKNININNINNINSINNINKNNNHNNNYHHSNNFYNHSNIEESNGVGYYGLLNSHFDIMCFQVSDIYEYMCRYEKDDFFFEQLIFYKIIYAYILLEYGILSQAQRYVEILYYYIDVIKNDRKKNSYLLYLYDTLLDRTKYIFTTTNKDILSLQRKSYIPSDEIIYTYKFISNSGITTTIPRDNMPDHFMHNNYSNNMKGYVNYNNMNDTNVNYINGYTTINTDVSAFNNSPIHNRNKTIHLQTQENINEYYNVKTNRTVTDYLGKKNVYSNIKEEGHQNSMFDGFKNNYNNQSYNENENIQSCDMLNGDSTTNMNVDSSNVHVQNGSASVHQTINNNIYHNNNNNNNINMYHNNNNNNMYYHNNMYHHHNNNKNYAYEHASSNVNPSSYFASEQNEAPYNFTIDNNNNNNNNNIGRNYNHSSVNSNTHHHMYNDINKHVSTHEKSIEGTYNYNVHNNNNNITSVYSQNFSNVVEQNNNVKDTFKVQNENGTMHGPLNAHINTHNSLYGNTKNIEENVTNNIKEKDDNMNVRNNNMKINNINLQNCSDNNLSSSQEQQQSANENNMDLINMGKSFISGFFSNIKEKIKKTEYMQEEEEEENIFYYDYEKKRWREKGVTSDEEKEREKQKLEKQMAMKNISPPPTGLNYSSERNKNPLNMTDVRSRYVDYFN